MIRHRVLTRQQVTCAPNASGVVSFVGLAAGLEAISREGWMLAAISTPNGYEEEFIFAMVEDVVGMSERFRTR